LDEIITLKQLLGSLGDPEPGQGFWVSAMSRIAPAISKRRAKQAAVRLRLAGVAITAAVLGFAALQIPMQTNAPEPVAVTSSETFDPATLISLHAMVRATRPLADVGKIRFAISEGNARDYANDASIDSL
jgi:hypothetical protein